MYGRNTYNPAAQRVCDLDGGTAVKNHYQILGVSANAKAGEIKAAWRKKAVRAHPDKGGNSDEFNRMHDAYEMLIDPVKRSEYDAELSAAKAQARRTSEPSREPPDPGYTWGGRRTPPSARRTPVRSTPPPRPQSASPAWWARMPKAVRDNAHTAALVLIVSWGAWILGRTGHLKANWIRSAPSLGAASLVVNIGVALACAWGVNTLARRAKGARKFLSWLGTGLAGLCVEPLVWGASVRYAVLGAMGVALAVLVARRMNVTDLARRKGQA